MDLSESEGRPAIILARLLGAWPSQWPRPASARLPRRPLRRVPRRALPGGARRARGRMLHPGRVERRAPAFLVVARELKVVALAVHAHRDAPNPGPRVQPGPKRVERAVVRGHGAPGECECCAKELAALVHHATRSPHWPGVGASAESSVRAPWRS